MIGRHNTKWGLLFVIGIVLAGFSVSSRADSTVVFNEIMYHPAEDGTSEWIEFYNQMAVDMDLSGWSVLGGISYTFPQGTVLQGGSYLVLAAVPDDLKELAQLDHVFGPFTGKLSNSGESLTLVSHNHRVMDQFVYDDEGDWPIAPDGSGVTLTKSDPDLGSAPVSSWDFSEWAGGTPGSANVSSQVRNMIGLRFNEIAACADVPFQLEFYNPADNPMWVQNLVLVCTGPAGGRYVFDDQFAGSGEYLVLDEATLGFRPDCGSRFFLFDPSESFLIDAALVSDKVRAVGPEGKWATPDSSTFGMVNRFDFNEAIVINEIMYHAFPKAEIFEVPFQESSEEWIELYNRSQETVDLSGWSFKDGIQFEFPLGTRMPADSYLIVTHDVNAFVGQYPGTAPICFGDFSGRLSNQGERLLLIDSQGNLVDEVHYYDGGQWPSLADGGGATLELRDPRANNARASAWAASWGSEASDWKAYEYTGIAQEDGIGPNIWHEFVLGLLSQGDVLLDDISVIEEPAGARHELIQNGTFDMDPLGAAPAAWRLIGTHGSHGRSQVIGDPDKRGNHVLHLVATGPTKDTHDHAETTLAGARQIRAGRTYRIAYKAKWLAGSNQLNTRLYFNWLQKTTSLHVPLHHGTPAARNSVFEDNIGPTFSSLSHTPVVPTTRSHVTISVAAHDNDGMNVVRLFYAVNSGPFDALLMTDQGDGLYCGTLPSHNPGDVVQFYVEATDGHASQAQMSWYPPAGPDSRALYVVQDGGVQPGSLHTLRLIMTEPDEGLLYRNTNLLSNDRLSATLVYDDKMVFYDVGVRLKGSGWGRTHNSERGYNIRFQPDQLFRGVHKTISVERGGSKKEIVAKHMFNAAGGGLGSLYDDVAYVITPRDTGVGLLAMARYTSLYLKSQYDNGGDGTLYNYELLYTPTSTVNGHPEGLKLNFPYTHTSGSFDFADYGDDKEAYRWFEQIRNNRVKDDYSLLIALSQACSLTDTALEDRITEVMDVSQWMRTFAMESLCGNDDFYGRAHDHNFRLYQRPQDNKMVALPWDLDRAFRLSTAAALWPTRLNLRKVIELPGNKRLYYGHLHDMINTTCNEDYMAPWTAHYSDMTGESFSGLLTYIRNRSSFVASRLPVNPERFVVTDTDFTTNEAEAVIKGEAGIGIKEVFVAGEAQPLAPVWSRSGNGQNERFFWQVRISLASGLNTLVFQAHDFQGNPAGSAGIKVIRTVH